jgi:hypothetical protein
MATVILDARPIGRACSPACVLRNEPIECSHDRLKGTALPVCPTRKRTVCRIRTLSASLRQVSSTIWALKPFGPWGATICGLYIVCAALRLARFNIQVGSVDKRRFVGLPVAGAAAVVAGVVLACRYFELARPGVLSASMAPTTLVLACLMISRVPYPSFKSINLRRASVSTMIAMLAAVSLLVIMPQLAAFLLAIGYLLSGPILMMRGERVELDVPGLWPVPKQYAGLRWRSDADHRDSARKLR